MKTNEKAKKILAAALLWAGATVIAAAVCYTVWAMMWICHGLGIRM